MYNKGEVMDLLEEAKKAKKPELSERRGKWADVAPAIHVLKDKRYTNKQIAKWLTTKGFRCTASDVSQANQRYKKDV